MKPIRIFTPCWGFLHLSRIRKGLLTSLAWPSNSAALRGRVAGWHFYGAEGDRGRCEDIAAAAGHPFEFEAIDTNDTSQSILKAATVLMRRCAEEGSLFMPVFADIVFGEGTLEALLALAERADVCVSAPHMRVLPSMLDKLSVTQPVSNAELVSLAMAHPHSTWAEAELGKRTSNGFYGGVSWEKRGGLYYVQHNLPSCWVANVNIEDAQFFHGQDGWGGYDHNWGFRLLADGRLRLVASSDAAFIVEATDALKNHAPVSVADPQKPDAFYRSGAHHTACRTFVGVWRPEPGPMEAA